MQEIEQTCGADRMAEERERPGRCANTVIPGLTLHRQHGRGAAVHRMRAPSDLASSLGVSHTVAV